MEQLEFLQDKMNGKFEQHKRLVNSYLKCIEDVKNTNMELKRATQQRARDAKCEKVFKNLQVVQSNGKLSKNENLFAMYSGCVEKEKVLTWNFPWQSNKHYRSCTTKNLKKASSF